jgi:hypothetical protein
MPSIQTFNDFMATTGPTYLTSADQVINEAVKNTYAFSRLLKNKTSEVTIQGGNEIRDVIMFDDSRTYDHYQPNDVFTWRNPQVTDTIKAPWRFSIDHMSWTDAEVELNTGETAASTKVAYKRLKRIKEQRLWTSMTNGFEEDLWAPPSLAQMEVESGRLPYSLPFFITEIGRNFGGSLGLRGTRPFTASANTSTVMGLDPTVDTRWTNIIEPYGYNSGAGIATEPSAAGVSLTFADKSTLGQGAGTTTSITVNPLFTAFDRMFMRIKYEAPSSHQEYFEKDTLNRQMILTSREGVQFYRRLLRLSNDTLVNYQDAAYSNPTYSGIPLTYCSDLDTAAIFPAHSATVADKFSGTAGVDYNEVVTTNADGAFSAFGTESGSTTIAKGPRYFFVNGNYLTPIFHSKRYFKTHEVLRHPNQPFTYVMPVDCWHNLFCNSRQRHGVVCPIPTATS